MKIQLLPLAGKDRIADLAGMFHYRQLGKFVCNNLL